ncbi:MAG: ABC transporter permease [Methylococcaceae bacterium]|nr:ABC transporter permease [Methylococcaceae bacterium]
MKIQSITDVIKNNLIIVGIFVLVIITSIVEPNFLKPMNFGNIIRQFGPLIMVALGMTFIIMGGMIDLSVGGIISLVGVVTVSLIDPIGQVAALIVGLTLGLICGLINSFLILKGGAFKQAEALFLTYGMSVVYGALALIYTGASPIFLSYSKTNYSIFTAIGTGSIGPVSVSFIIFLVCLLILYIIESKTHIGRSICLTGGNKIAARLAGIPTERTIVFIYAVSGVMSAIGAIVLLSRVTIVSPLMGKGYETQAILAVVVGGTALIGGKGSVLRTVIGTLLIILMSNCLNLLGVTTFIQYMLRGAILILAIWLDNRKQYSEGN